MMNRICVLLIGIGAAAMNMLPACLGVPTTSTAQDMAKRSNLRKDLAQVWRIEEASLDRRDELAGFVQRPRLIAWLGQNGIKTDKEPETRAMRDVAAYKEWELNGVIASMHLVPKDQERGDWTLSTAVMGNIDAATDTMLLNMNYATGNIAPVGGMKWQGKSLGEVSVGYLDAKRDYSGTCVFRRGNVAAYVRGGPGVVGKPKADARELAALIDQYLVTSPIEGKKADEVAKIAKCTILLADITTNQPASQYRVGQQYTCSLADLPKDAEKYEFRAYVKNGEIQADETGKLSVSFSKGGKNSIEVFFVDDKLQVAAMCKSECDVTEPTGVSRPASAPDDER